MAGEWKAKIEADVKELERRSKTLGERFDCFLSNCFEGTVLLDREVNGAGR